jgi:steroid delta-isomerase-like uncharacterized protein
MSEQNKTLVRRLVDEIWNKKDINKLEELLTPQCSLQTPEGTVRGPKEYRQFVETYQKAFPDCKIAIDEILAEDNMVSARCTLTGTHKGELRGIAPTGKQVRAQSIMLAKISGGKIAEEVISWDRLSMFEQLGVAPEAVNMAARRAGH